MSGITGTGLIELGYVAEVDFKLYDNGSGVYIGEWNHPDPQPTVAEIEAAEIMGMEKIEQRLAAEEALRQSAISFMTQRLGKTAEEVEAMSPAMLVYSLIVTGTLVEGEE